MTQARQWLAFMATWACAAALAEDLPAGLVRFNPAGLPQPWSYEGVAFRAFLAPQTDVETRPVTLGGTAFHAPVKEGIPVHKFVDAGGTAYYTPDKMPPAQWKDEGIAFRAYRAGGSDKRVALADIWRYRRDGPRQYAYTGARENPYVVGAFYFGLFAPSGTQSIEGSERVHGRKNDWWGGVSDFYGKEKGIPADRRGWSGDFPELKPAIGYYDQRAVATLEQHIRQADEAGLSFFSFYWYWSLERGDERLPEALASFQRARNPGGLRFNLALYAPPWDDDMVIDPANAAAPIAKLVDHFAHPLYLRLPDGRPVFVIGDVRNIRDTGGVRCVAIDCFIRVTERFIAVLKQATRARLGVEPFVQLQPGPGWERVKNADGLSCLLPDVQLGNGRPYPNFDVTVYAAWEATGKPVSPCMLHNFDERPRQDVQIRERGMVRYFVGKTDAAFRRNLEATKRFSDTSFAKDRDPAKRIVYLYAWNEWHEGGILEPNATTGARDLNIVTDVFDLPRRPSPCLERAACR